jgi:hypothetical protein
MEQLVLGRSHLLQSQREPNHLFTESANPLHGAVDGLRQAGQKDDLSLALLARAEFFRVTDALDKAEKDLDEAFTIATRGGMRLFEADCHLEHARLYLAHLRPAKSPQGERIGEGTQSKDMLAMTPEELKAKAREHWEIAKKMIEEMGYHRRDKEVEELEGQLK